MPDDFQPANAPSISSGKEVEYRWLEAEFSSGYTQRAGDGLNNKKRTYNISIEALTQAEVEAIEDFLDSHSDGSSFTYTFPGESTQRKFICKKYSKAFPSGVLFSITAEFKEVFDL